MIWKSLPSTWLTIIFEVLWSCQAWSEAKEEAIQVSEAAGSVLVGHKLLNWFLSNLLIMAERCLINRKIERCQESERDIPGPASDENDLKWP